MDVRVGTVDEVRSEGCRIVDVGGRRIGVISVGDDFFAINDKCPHMGASMSAGSLGGTMLASTPHEYVYGKDDRVIRCPWHGWEFDLETGRSLLEPKRSGLGVYRVTQEDGHVVLHA
ncbi:Rieske (2Fe-2S) protein [Nocardioides lijunqiniae]|uniref:Rieske (2Fe-2S) protein n=1 Tax=Nocardioides lijunqiniae TaxID=2760832 RepID=UPI001878A763|nr:Rieske (2Fe-2S) protein [Nocardioides lijunqiniae]